MKLKCIQCKEILECDMDLCEEIIKCDESYFKSPLECSECGTPILIRDHSTLRKIVKKKEEECQLQREKWEEEKRAEKQKRLDKIEKQQQEKIAKKQDYEITKKVNLSEGVGCPRCGSLKISQSNSTSGGGWALFLIGILLCCFTFGLSLILCLGIFGMKNHRARCQECWWTWSN